MPKSVSVDIAPACDMAGKLIDWYWSYGMQREGRYQLSAAWVDGAYRAQSVLNAAQRGQRADKPSLGIWGPSQTGKSTLISYYLDDRDGSGSALTWPNGAKARFARSLEHEDIVALNPFNHKSDASGCVSRFVLLEDKDLVDQQHPVQLKLATAEQIMHALAAGYLSECANKNDDGESVFFDANMMLAHLDALGGDGRLNRSAFEELVRVVDIIEMLVHTNAKRYDNLNANQSWERSVRKAILGSPVLGSNPSSLRKFAADIFWDGHEALSQVNDKLAGKIDRLKALWGARPVYCTMEVAALFLDIDSYQALLRGMETPPGSTSDVDQKTLDMFNALSWKIDGDHVLIGRDLGEKLCNSSEDFGLMQGLVWELVVPLRKKTLEKNQSSLLTFLEKADIVDFPGVALQYDNVEDAMIDLREVADGEPDLLTKVLKRGKTASIVTNYAKSLSLDSFLLLARVGAFPAQPQQLLSGIEMWWKTFDPDFNPRHSEDRRSPLPLGIALTFFGQLVNNVGASGIGGGLKPVVEMTRKLGILADPDVSTFYTLTYPQYPEGKIDLDEGGRKAVGNLIEDDKSFNDLFRHHSSKQSFKAMMSDDDGGVDYLFKSLGGNISLEPRLGRLVKLVGRSIGSIATLMDDVAPDAGGELEKLRSQIHAFGDLVISHLEQGDERGEGMQAAATCSAVLRRLLDVGPETLEPLPLNASSKGARETRVFVESQFSRWAQSKDGLVGWDAIDPENKINAHLVLDLIADVAIGECRDNLVTWVRSELGHLNSVGEARICRRYLAYSMSNAILAGTSGWLEHVDPSAFSEEGGNRLNAFALAELTEGNYQQSPHFHAFIDPFFRRLNEIVDGLRSERPPQPGDDEIVDLMASALALNEAAS